MKKLRLDLDDLSVEAFMTSGAQAETGTVRGHYPTYGCETDVSCVQTCFFESCYESACGRCVDTYDGTCDIYCTYTGGTSCNEPCPSCMRSYCPSNCTGESNCTYAGYC